MGAVGPFVNKLWSVVNDPTVSHVIKWGDGDSIIVTDERLFVATVLPRLCRSKNFPSFVRQLNGYGFGKRDTAQYAWGHPSFRQGCPHLLPTIMRKRGNGVSAARALDDGDGDDNSEKGSSFFDVAEASYSVPSGPPQYAVSSAGGVEDLFRTITLEMESGAAAAGAAASPVGSRSQSLGTPPLHVNTQTDHARTAKYVAIAAVNALRDVALACSPASPAEGELLQQQQSSVASAARAALDSFISTVAPLLLGPAGPSFGVDASSSSGAFGVATALTQTTSVGSTPALDSAAAGVRRQTAHAEQLIRIHDALQQLLGKPSLRSPTSLVAQRSVGSFGMSGRTRGSSHAVPLPSPPFPSGFPSSSTSTSSSAPYSHAGAAAAPSRQTGCKSSRASALSSITAAAAAAAAAAATGLVGDDGSGGDFEADLDYAFDDEDEEDDETDDRSGRVSTRSGNSANNNSGRGPRRHREGSSVSGPSSDAEEHHLHHQVHSRSGSGSEPVLWPASTHSPSSGANVSNSRPRKSLRTSSPDRDTLLVSAAAAVESGGNGLFFAAQTMPPRRPSSSSTQPGLHHGGAPMHGLVSGAAPSHAAAASHGVSHGSGHSGSGSGGGAAGISSNGSDRGPAAPVGPPGIATDHGRAPFLGEIASLSSFGLPLTTAASSSAHVVDSRTDSARAAMELSGAAMEIPQSSGRPLSMELQHHTRGLLALSSLRGHRPSSVEAAAAAAAPSSIHLPVERFAAVDAVDARGDNLVRRGSLPDDDGLALTDSPPADLTGTSISSDAAASLNRMLSADMLMGAADASPPPPGPRGLRFPSAMQLSMDSSSYHEPGGGGSGGHVSGREESSVNSNTSTPPSSRSGRTLGALSVSSASGGVGAHSQGMLAVGPALGGGVQTPLTPSSTAARALSRGMMEFGRSIDSTGTDGGMHM